MFPEDLHNKLSEFKKSIEQAKTIVLFWHENIDQDSLWAMLGLGHILEKQGKNIAYYTTTQPVQAHSFDYGFEKIKTVFDYGEYDLLLFIDFCEYSRIQWFTDGHEEYFNKKQKVVIDHHIMTSEYPNALLMRDETSSSTCGICYEICSQTWPEQIDTISATLWYTWLMTDTWNFMRSKKPQRDYSIAMGLLDHGADKDFVIKNLYHTAPEALIPMAAITLWRATIKWDIVYTWYTQQELDDIWLSDDDIEAAHMLLRSIKDIPVFLRLRRMDTTRSGSLRSGRDKNGYRYNVQTIAASFWKWGGHVLAAGFSVDADNSLSIEEDIRRIVSLVQSQIDIQKNT